MTRARNARGKSARNANFPSFPSPARRPIYSGKRSPRRPTQERLMSDQLPPASSDTQPSRRELFAALAAIGVGSEVFQRALAVQVEKPAPITADSVREAEWVAGLSLSAEERKSVARTLAGWQRNFRKLRAI